MQNARTPGAVRYRSVPKIWELEKKSLLNTALHPSITRLMMANVTAIEGDSQKIVAAGLSSPRVLFCSNSCAKPQRSPPSALAVMTSKNPWRIKWVSVATMSRTPENMRVITPIRRHENFSKRKRKANSRTKISEEDLHIAEG